MRLDKTQLNEQVKLVSGHNCVPELAQKSFLATQALYAAEQEMKLGKGKNGVALIAAVAQTKVVPVGINFEGSKLARKKKVVVRYGKPIDPKELGTTDASTGNIKKLKKRIMEEISNLVY